ncbi:hypothetical protein PICST_32891 [Scheffersomyces stipitis CBS 6054]|uniref:Uncharacterized protein n=1 Tax=Scheffersomyces stipitis (strain ATCC 58785 / CBS 6054 / NBRC 10063 / NRRL Y-11545) TaxID=322104 RepID=A3LXQ1_PICST|nr:hypothetical protein PICST_32891 [Scheffersomyces stipitis CBS 6054]ABN67504.2 hypothetical protein PICST_32891 [Scheffersomyces stipitis CBS 6054]KAG2732598.1 hypothetical protein G9P44_005015 [Scheffersomyces stipitis]
MSSLPTTSSFLTSSANKRAHRHKRSAAISGDFDASGLFCSPTHQSSISLTSHSPRQSFADDNADLERNYHFNNEEDFSNNGSNDIFSYPSKNSDIFQRPALSPRHLNSLSPVRKPNIQSSSFGLNSPIRLNRSRSGSTSNSLLNKSRLFLTEETTINSENIPEAVIDLDVILNANLHIGVEEAISDSPRNYHTHKRTESAPAEFAQNDDFLGSPFSNQTNSKLISSSLHNSHSMFSSGVNSGVPLFSQPIQEQMTDSIIEEGDNDEFDFDGSKLESSELVSDTDSTHDIFANPPPMMGNVFYTNASANSSTSSLRSGGNTSKHLVIEKTFSNSSKDSCCSFNGSNGNLTSNKRSGAKANRYKLFYDKSSRISNALKENSSDSINIVRSNSSGHSMSTANTAYKDLKLLGHSSSLPSLKSGPKRINSQAPSSLRYSDKRSNSENRRAVSPPARVSEKVYSASSPSLISERKESSTGCRFSDEIAYDFESRDRIVIGQAKKPEDPKISSTSPISTKSINSSAVISNSGTLHSTDNSSFLSHHEVLSKEHAKSDYNELSRDAEVVVHDRLQNITPSIVISAESESSSPSTNSTFQQIESVIRSNSKIKPPHIEPSLNSRSASIDIENASKEDLNTKKERKQDDQSCFLQTLPVQAKLTSPDYTNVTLSSKVARNSCIVSPMKAGIRNSQTDSEKKKSTHSKRKSIYNYSENTISGRKGKPTAHVENEENELMAVGRGRHSKSKSMSFTLSDLNPKVSNTEADNVDFSKTKRRERLLNWFRKR